MNTQGSRGQMGGLSHEGGKAGPTRDAAMFAWITNTQSAAEFWAFKFRPGIRRGEIRGFLYSPRAKGQVLAQGTKGLSHVVRNAQGWKEGVRGGSELPIL